MAPLFADKHRPAFLLVKTSSLGDVLHNLPVISDIMRHFPNAQIDWVVEESFAALPRLHPAVRNTISVAVRRWRGNLISATTWSEISAFRRTLSTQHYDVAIDTQGLLKSALLMSGTQGLRCGFDRSSAREPLAASLYQRRFQVSRELHAVERNRQLAAQAIGYALDVPADYGIFPPDTARPDWLPESPYVVLLHSTSRADKLWSEANWITLGRYLQTKNIRCILPWGNDSEKGRSQRLSDGIPNAVVTPRLNLNAAAALLGGARVVFGVDTGLAHLAAALGTPTIGIYVATDPALTGLYAGKCAVNIGNIGHIPEPASVIGVMQQIAAC